MSTSGVTTICWVTLKIFSFQLTVSSFIKLASNAIFLFAHDEDARYIPYIFLILTDDDII